MAPPARRARATPATAPWPPTCAATAEARTPATSTAYGSDQLTGDLCGLLDHYGYERAVFSGHDWGSMVVWELGRLHPERVAAICNLSVPYSHASGPPTEIFRHVFGDGFFYMLYFQDVGPAEAEFDADPRRYVRTVLYAGGGEAMANPNPLVTNAPAEGTGFLDILTPPPDVLPSWLTEHDVDVYTEGLRQGGLFGPVSFYRNLDANWERCQGRAGLALRHAHRLHHRVARSGEHHDAGRGRGHGRRTARLPRRHRD